jgi:A/G-specific adenine glycosylase
MTADKDILEHFDRDIAAKFVKNLLKWNKTKNGRQMPWKGEKDPYRIWLSEIILQQTRVEQGLAYYQRFIENYPCIKHLALAPEQEVFKLWEGLGYYSRCKNLIETARYIHNELNGAFPKDYDRILALKGIGSYTAAAISSFAYNLPYAVLDGNVFRVLSRIFDIETPIDTSDGKSIFARLAQSIIPDKNPAEYNQAMMDFGATICKRSPECPTCFFNTKCSAFIQGKQLSLPVKLKRVSVKTRWFTYVVVKHKQRYAIQQRTTKDIWQNLFEFCLIETKKALPLNQQLLMLNKHFEIDADKTNLKQTAKFKQRLSHQLIHFQFIVTTASQVPKLPENVIWVEASQLKNYAFPKTIQQYIQSYPL